MHLKSDSWTPKPGKTCGPPRCFRGSQNTHAEGVRVSQLRKRTQERKIGVWFFGVDPWNQSVCLQKRTNCVGPPTVFGGPQNTHAEDVRVSQLRKRMPERKIGVRFVGVDPLESDGLPPKTVKFCGPLLLFPRAAKHSRRGREGFPAEKTDAGTQNWSPVFSGSSPSNQTICLQKRSNFASPPAGFRGPQSTHAEGVRDSQLRKWSPVCKI
jgi:hypothetical protein